MIYLPTDLKQAAVFGALANAIKEAIYSPTDFNVAAILTANLLCEGLDKQGIVKLSHFLQLLLNAIKSYALG